MELLVFVGLLIVLAWLSLRYGSDSREAVQSKEAELACLGVKWPEPVQRHRASRIRRVRRGIAWALLALAEWLSPGAPARAARG